MLPLTFLMAAFLAAIPTPGAIPSPTTLTNSSSVAAKAAEAVKAAKAKKGNRRRTRSRMEVRPERRLLAGIPARRGPNCVDGNPAHDILWARSETGALPELLCPRCEPWAGLRGNEFPYEEVAKPSLAMAEIAVVKP